MTTHEVESILGISKQTLIYYEKEGFIKPQRSANNYRNYSSNDLDVLKLILLLRSMEISVDEIIMIFDEKLSIREVLEKKQKFIKQTQDRLEDIGEKIKTYIKRRKVKVYFDYQIDHQYEHLLINEDNIYFNETIIAVKDINKIDLLMCSSKGDEQRAYFLLNYYVDMDIHTFNDTYSFQIMNNDKVTQLFDYLVRKNIEIYDPLGLVTIYYEKRDPVLLNKYLNRHFRIWADEYHLDNPRDNYLSIMKEAYIKPFENLKKESKGNILSLIKNQLDELKNIFSRRFRKGGHYDD